jgi:hypothetical protein
LDAWVVFAQTYLMTTQLKETATHLIDELRERHAARVAHRHLRAELASYTTAAEISDLLAAVTRFGGSSSKQISPRVTAPRSSPPE